MYSQKETSLLEDLKKAEEVCITKYSKFADDASASELKDLFIQIGQQEQQHLQTIEQIISGTIPSMNSGQSGQQPTIQEADYSSDNAAFSQDSFLCADLLSTEKHVSSSYDTSIFEFKNPQVRDALNHIQKEEQDHGEMIYSYMATNGMYN